MHLTVNEGGTLTREIETSTQLRNTAPFADARLLSAAWLHAVQDVLFLYCPARQCLPNIGHCCRLRRS